MSNLLNAAFKTVLGVSVGTAPVLNGFPPEAANTLSPEALTVLAMMMASLGGAYASFSWGEPVAPRGKMIRLFVSCVIMGLGFSVLVNASIEYATDGFTLTLGAKTGLSAVVSCLTRFVMPKIVEGIRDGSWRNLIPFIPRRIDK